MESVRTRSVPFGLRPGDDPGWARTALGAGAPVLERLLGLHELGRLHADVTGSARVDDFPERALDRLGIRWQIADGALGRIPATGPLIVVANHPFGAADGLVLLALIRRVRRDVRLLGNQWLQRIPELRDLVIGVDTLGGRDAHAGNRRMLRRAVDWARRGGVVLIFPAGEVSATRAPGNRLIDRAWKRGVARLVTEGEAPVLPVYFDGRNSAAFALAGRLHPALRTAMLPRELLRQRGRVITPQIGAPIPHRTLSTLDDETMVRYLRARTYGLRPNRAAASSPVPAQVSAPPAAAVDPGLVRAEVTRLPAGRILASSRDLQVIYAHAAEIPSLLREIGRLREVAFRAVGEGTGRALDLDRFDARYLHLFAWHRGRREVVGAYRLGLSDRLLEAEGPDGFYTRTLFRFDRALVDRLGPSIELGRSFVRPEYQREFGPLLLLWQGIARFAARHPRYRRLFGPVSISASYRPAATDAIVSALEAAARTSPYAGLATPRRAYVSLTGVQATTLIDAPASAHDLVGEIDPDAGGLPVLLRQYLKLGATPVAVSVDPSFADAIDALMVVDLDQVPLPLLNRYMGAEGLAAFRMRDAA